MSLTIREQIHANLASILTAGLSGFSNLRVERNRDAQVQSFPTINIIDGPHDIVEPESTGLTEFHLHPVIEGFVAAESPADLGPAINELYGQTMSVLLQDRSLGGVAIDLSEVSLEPLIGRQERQAPTMGFSLELLVKFCTAEDDPYVLGPK